MTLTKKDQENGWKSVEVFTHDVIKYIDDDDFDGLSSLLFRPYADLFGYSNKVTNE